MVAKQVEDIEVWRGRRIEEIVKEMPEEQAWEALENLGVSRTKISEMYNVHRATILNRLGPKRKNPSVKREQRNVRVMPAAWEHMEKIAADMGLVIEEGEHQGEGSVRDVIELIAEGHLLIVLRGQDDEPAYR